MGQDLEAYELDCEPCEAGTPNPKQTMRNGRRSSGAFGDVTDPIAEEMRDIDRARMVYAQIPIVPFFDDSDATLKVLRRMRELSPTHSGCVSSQQWYMFGGELTTRRYVEPGMAFDTESEDVTDAEKMEFISFVKGLSPEMTLEHVLNVAKDIDDNLETYGNAFLRLDAVRIGGKEYYYIENVDAEKCRYYATQPRQPKIVVISPEWTSEFITKYPPEFVSHYPEWSDYGNGVRSSIIHIKTTARARDWYGLPISFGSLYWQYLEVQQGQHGTQGYANDFIARVFFEITAEPETDSDEDNFDDAVKRTFTNQASRYGNAPKRYIIRRRLPDDTPATVHEFKANTEHEYHESMGAQAERQIIKTHGWHSLLMGMPTAGKLSNSSEFKEVYRVYYNNRIRPKQETALRPIITAFQAFETMQRGKMDVTARLSLGLYNLYSDYLTTETPAQVQKTSAIESTDPTEGNADTNV